MSREQRRPGRPRTGVPSVWSVLTAQVAETGQTPHLWTVPALARAAEVQTSTARRALRRLEALDRVVTTVATGSGGETLGLWIEVTA